MAAPTPVSSLVHSSTLVTAGVYVLIRFNYFFVFGGVFLKVFSLLTILLAGLTAILENDFKKVVAISTLRQLGMIIFILSVGVWLYSYIHIIIHAFFKRMLFLRAGSLIGQSAGLQDSRFYGNLSSSYMSFVYFVVSCFCLAGFPFFIGFYSKDSIILSLNGGKGGILFILFICACFFTVVYSLRLIKMAYYGNYKYTTFLRFFEDSRFFVVVSLLFLKC